MRKSAGFSSLIDARPRPQSDKQAKHSRPAQPNLAHHASATDRLMRKAVCMQERQRTNQGLIYPDSLRSALNEGNQQSRLTSPSRCSALDLRRQPGPRRSYALDHAIGTLCFEWSLVRGEAYAISFPIRRSRAMRAGHDDAYLTVCTVRLRTARAKPQSLCPRGSADPTGRASGADVRGARRPTWPAGDGEEPRGAGTDGRRSPWYDVDVRGRQMERREDGAKTRKCARFGWRRLLDLRVYYRKLGLWTA
jgi:hypothetical protein